MLFRLTLTLTILMVLTLPCCGALVHGTVYSWENLKPLPKAIVVVNSTPIQRVVTKNGSYSFNLPPGNYVIKAYYYQNGKLMLYDEDNITIKKNGSYIVDLILFPPLKFNISQPNVEFEVPQKSSNNSIVVLAVSLAALTGAVLTGLYVARLKSRKEKKVENSQATFQTTLENLPEDLKEALKEIVNSGGRITQKELRSRLKYSEAKVSLIISDLERRGIVEKVKKGRGNVIFLKDDRKMF